MNIYLRQRWVDPRLAFMNYSKADMLELDIKLMSQVWVPDTFFRSVSLSLSLSLSLFISIPLLLSFLFYVYPPPPLSLYLSVPLILPLSLSISVSASVSICLCLSLFPPLSFSLPMYESVSLLFLFDSLYLCLPPYRYVLI